MSYRKITVNGKEYQYVIGRTHTKIKGLGVWTNESIAPKVEVQQYCECCGESMTYLYDNYALEKHVAVMPNHISALIRAYS